MSLNKQIGERIRTARKHAGLTQVQLGRKLVKSGAAIAYLEQGKRRIDPDILSKISGITGKSMAYFYDQDSGELTDKLADLRYQLNDIKTLLNDTEKQKQVVEEKKKIYFHAFNRSITGICITDLEGNIMDANESFAAILGYSTDELIGMHVSAFHPENRSYHFVRSWSIII